MVNIQNILGTPTTQQNKYITWLKNGQITYINISPKKTYNGLHVYEKMLNITNNEGNANQNHQILSHIYYDGHYKNKTKNQRLTGTGKDAEKLEPVHCWWDCKMV